MKNNQTQKNISDGWEKKRLDEVADFFNGKGHEKDIDENGDYVVVNSKFISSDGSVRKYSNEFLVPLEKGDVTMVMSDVPNGKAIAKCFFIDEDNKYTLNQRIGGFKSKKVLNKFLQLALNRNRYFLSFNDGVNQTNLRKDDILSCPIVLPPLPEQERIVSVLETWDSGIEKLKQKIEIKKQIKKGLMQELLTGKRRLPGFSDEWELVKLGNLGDCLRGVSYKPKTDLVENDALNTYRLLRSNNIKNDSINIDDIQIVIGEKVKKSQVMIDGDILICTANGSKRLVGKSGIYRAFDNHNYTFGAFMGLFRFNKDIDKDLASYLFKSSKYKFYISNLLSGSSINNLKPSDIESMQFNFPKNTEEQKAIAEILTAADDEITTLGKKLTLWQEQKKYLLNNLVTGQIRTSEDLVTNQT